MKFLRRSANFAASAVVIFFLTTIPLLAAEGAEPDPTESTAGLIFRWLNFALVFGGIAYLIKKYGGAFFGTNAKAIAASITEAQTAKAAADRELSEVNVKISRLEPEVAEMRESARRDVAAEGERLRASAAAEIEKIKLAARAELAASERAAQQQLQAVAASLAVERAGELIIARMTQEVRSRLFHTFLGELGRNAN
jgi:F0F1-type ATP synthase membrane subunit b/b'